MTTTLSDADLDVLRAYADGEHIPDIALRLGVTVDEAGIRLANLCGAHRGHAQDIVHAHRTRSTRSAL